MGYTAPTEVCKSALVLSCRSEKLTMSRLVVIVILLLLAAGGAYYLSTLPRAQPTSTIEVDVLHGDNAQ